MKKILIGYGEAMLAVATLMAFAWGALAVMHGNSMSAGAGFAVFATLMAGEIAVRADAHGTACHELLMRSFARQKLTLDGIYKSHQEHIDLIRGFWEKETEQVREYFDKYMKAQNETYELRRKIAEQEITIERLTQAFDQKSLRKSA